MAEINPIAISIAQLRKMLMPPPKPAALQLAERALKKARVDLSEIEKAENAANQKDRDDNRQVPSAESKKLATAAHGQRSVVRNAQLELDEQRDLFGKEFLRHLGASKDERIRVLSELIDLFDEATDIQVDVCTYAAANNLPTDRLVAASPRLAQFAREARSIIRGDW